MRRLVVPIVAFSLGVTKLACVPASEPRPPAGAGGFRTVLSPGARGEPFVTSDGWTVTCEKLIARIDVSVQRDRGVPGDYSEYSYGSSEEFVFDARSPQVLFAPGARVGPARVQGYVRGRYLYQGIAIDDDNASVLGVSDTDLRRMSRSSDYSRYVGSVNGTPTNYGPSVLVRLSGTRGDVKVTTPELALAPDGPIPGPGSGFADGGTSLSLMSGAVDVEIRANALAAVLLDVAPENVFDESFPFSRIADADTDGDGIATANELSVAPGLVYKGSTTAPPEYMALGVLSARIGVVLFRTRPE